MLYTTQVKTFFLFFLLELGGDELTLRYITVESIITCLYSPLGGAIIAVIALVVKV